MYKDDRNIKHIILDKPQNHSPNQKTWCYFWSFLYLINPPNFFRPQKSYFVGKKIQDRSEFLKGSQHFAYQPPLATVQGAAISNDETWQSFFVFLPSQRFTWNLKMARPAIGDSCWKNMVHLKMARPASRRFLLGNHHFLGFHDKPTWSVYTSPWWVLVRVDHPQNQFPTTWKEVFRKHSWSR